ncbi:MAG TPA: hypothetical protein DGG95_15575, partial [Cytophagales bacterium]|nr:hypothetical protein [Cytophagales bacterium]
MKAIRRNFQGTVLAKDTPVIRFLKWVLLVLFVAMALWPVFAQSNRLETEKGLTEAIAPFDADVRYNIF